MARKGDIWRWDHCDLEWNTWERERWRSESISPSAHFRVFVFLVLSSQFSWLWGVTERDINFYDLSNARDAPKVRSFLSFLTSLLSSTKSKLETFHSQRLSSHSRQILDLISLAPKHDAFKSDNIDVTDWQRLRKTVDKLIPYVSSNSSPLDVLWRNGKRSANWVLLCW